MAVSASTNLGAMAAKRYIDANNQKVTRSTEELASGSRVSNPAYDPSAAAVGFSLNAISESLLQAGRNVSQTISEIQMASGALGSTQELLTRMKTLTTQANSDAIGDSERKMVDQEFQRLLEQVDVNASNARWGGVSLFTGGSGTAAAIGVVAEGVTGLTAVANAFTNAINAGNTQGLIEGIATNAKVTANGALFDVSVTVGEQTFKATVAAPVAGGTLNLTSTTDSGNVISFNYHAADVTGFTGTAANFEANLKTLLGVNSATKAVFASLSTSANGMANVTLTAGAGTNAGTWALTYTGAAAGGTGTFKLTRGDEVFTASATTSANMTRSVTFDNGVNLALAAFDGTSNKAQECYSVSSGTAVTQTIQFGEKSSDILSLTFRSASVSGLGLSGLDVTTKGNAQTAGTLIDTATKTVNNSIAELGGKLSQLNFMATTISTTVQNLTSARATFVDADISESMLAMNRYKGLGQISQSVFTDALNQQSNLARMVQNVQ